MFYFKFKKPDTHDLKQVIVHPREYFNHVIVNINYNPYILK
jgi:hypothetical protein